MTTTTINDTVVQLEALHTAYATILEQAKAQLESLELSPSDVKSLSLQLSRTGDFKTAVVAGVYTQLRNEIKGVDNAEFAQDYAGNQLCMAIAQKVLVLVKQDIAEFAALKIKEIVEGYKLEKIVTNQINENVELHNSVLIKDKLAQLLKGLE